MGTIGRFEVCVGWLVILCAAIGMTGCGVQASVFPVHETKVEYHQSEKPLFCSFFTCQGGTEK